jgi:tRNA (cytidine32/uridine32-2'-O)-methyltransferase
MINIQVVLVATSHPGNIGAAARAMKAMGLENLILVSPKIFPHVEATARAAGADDLLAKAKIVNTLHEAVADSNLVFGTSARMRAFSLELIAPRAAAAMITTLPKHSKVSMVFGRENNGLSNEELKLCNYHIHIPTATNFSSLNLAAAVQIMAYEIKLAFTDVNPTTKPHEQLDLAHAQDIFLLQQHLETTLQKVNFLDPNNPKKLTQRLHRLLTRAHLEKTEVNILRGILTAIDNAIRR